MAHLLGDKCGAPGTPRITALEDRKVRRAVRRILKRVELATLAERAERDRRERLDVRSSPDPVGCSDMHGHPSDRDRRGAQGGHRAGREDGPRMSGVSRAHALANLALLGVEVTANIRLGVPIVTSSVSPLTRRGASGPTYVLDEDEELANLFARPSVPEVDYSQPAPSEGANGRTVGQ